MEDIENCNNCGKKYYVIEIGGGMPGGREPEEISCPFCRHTFTRRSSGGFRTTPVSEDKQ